MCEEEIFNTKSHANIYQVNPITRGRMLCWGVHNKQKSVFLAHHVGNFCQFANRSASLLQCDKAVLGTRFGFPATSYGQSLWHGRIVQTILFSV